ncbi:hypothetical protein [Pseudosulfitobacter pseudonitzschiae]|uniref:hypothetical protein n=1 Tax=Pseudosulfitobacter pseudonitzschiae TaxID=1402135 RepID=UPI001AFC7128|nr:hypothetical protein [Pseudosulfitobacter pseudonitzschiae]MBM1814533.1 hypothetical protein [Pseudosulfitobacter pseudonitzschiae]MBM1831527.1 hypothetical protein [Pseudosulfitobacter pseudonitzschiae]MBM1836393.1 hypothetical protein [Pseudosulfitobacter pseudonitzschiae]MBM1841239.1 hypothetical protein [Pseudosulfitobacter pseudonitzschiae]MBM1846107.1 hypothetical protein [Pseudosulfitobacter pseudonitzschiae]
MTKKPEKLTTLTASLVHVPEMPNTAMVERFSPYSSYLDTEPYVDMEPDELGDWVRLSDYQALAKHIRTPVAEERVRSIKSLEGNLLALDARLSILEAKQ